MDPTGHDALARWLAYGHPAWMLTSLGLALQALRLGLRMRQARQRGARRDADLFRRHLRFAKPAVVMLVLGFGGGLASSYWLRGWTPLERFHGWVGIVCIALFVFVSFEGRRLERGRGGRRERHALAAALALLLSGLSAVSGFVLLP